MHDAMHDAMHDVTMRPLTLYAVVGSKEVEGRTLSLNFRRGDGEGVLDLGSVEVQEALDRIELSAKTATPIPDLFEAGHAEEPAAGK